MSEPRTERHNQTRTRYGTAHPEWVENPLWQLSIENGWTGYALRQHVGHDHWRSGKGQECRNPSHSSYRDSEPGPAWSWERFGRTTTALPDGRVIHIAGEHEDSYDSDFCIYNDVVVEYSGGRREIYLYPRDVFPPTDFHTATLIGDTIWMIGSLGYHDLRRPGTIQVLKFDIHTLRFEHVVTTGENPGWINGHIAERIGETTILVSGGKVQRYDRYDPNEHVFEFDIATGNWTRRAHGDESIFPVSAADYRKLKNPAYGTENPERSQNRFWLEMARHNWAPSRARLHFGDHAPPEPKLALFAQPADLGEETPEFGTPEYDAWFARLTADIEASKLKRTRGDIVWTAVREESLCLKLADGRQLQIGGEVSDYGDEYADPWIYNDIIVRHPDGTIEIFVYPPEIFPHLTWPNGIEDSGHVYIFGIFNRRYYPGRWRGPTVLRLDPATFSITPLDVREPKERVSTYPGSLRRDGRRVIFPITRQTQADPELGLAFDLDTHTWSNPFPHVALGFDDED